MPEPVGQYMVADLAPRQPESGKTKRWLIRSRSNNGLLGPVRWYGAWRGYVFGDDPVFSPGCLRDLADFMERQIEQQKAGRK